MEPMIDLLRFRLFEGEDFMAFSPVDVRGRAYAAMLSPRAATVNNSGPRMVKLGRTEDHFSWAFGISKAGLKSVLSPLIREHVASPGWDSHTPALPVSETGIAIEGWLFEGKALRLD